MSDKATDTNANDNTSNTQTSESPAVNKLNELRNNEPVSPTPTSEEHKSPEDNELSDNERKAENELAELKRTNALHITDDHHKEAALKETIEYEKGQKQQRADIAQEHTNTEQVHGEDVTQRQHEKFKSQQ